MRKRSEAGSAKPSAAERTIAMPGTGVEPGMVRCGACGEWVRPDPKLRNSAGRHECPECGAALAAGAGESPPVRYCAACGRERVQSPSGPTCENGHVGAADVGAAGAVPIRNVWDLRTKCAAAPGTPVDTRKPCAYCSECGSEWPIVEGRAWPNCGHPSATPIEDPSMAKRIAPPAGLQGRVPEPVAASSSTRVDEQTSGGLVKHPSGAEVSMPRTPAAAAGGTKLFVSWGKARIPIDRYNAIEVGGHSITVEIVPDADAVEEAGRIVSQLEAIADRLFEQQWAWYQRKMRLTGGAE